MARKTIHSTGGFWLILGALLLAASLRLLFWAAVAAAVHELGHVAAVRALGGRVGSFRLTGVGAVIQPRRERMFSYGEECLVALAGPAASVLLAIGAAAWGRHFGGADAYLLTGAPTFSCSRHRPEQLSRLIPRGRRCMAEASSLHP